MAAISRGCSAPAVFVRWATARWIFKPSFPSSLNMISPAGPFLNGSAASRVASREQQKALHLSAAISSKPRRVHSTTSPVRVPTRKPFAQSSVFHKREIAALAQPGLGHQTTGIYTAKSLLSRSNPHARSLYENVFEDQTVHTLVQFDHLRGMTILDNRIM